jgi:hypothetical protein
MMLDPFAPDPPPKPMIGKFVLDKTTGENLDTFERELRKMIGDFKEATGMKIEDIHLLQYGEGNLEIKIKYMKA